MVGRKRERKERGGGKREKKMDKCVFGMERKMKGRKNGRKKWCVRPTILFSPKSERKNEGKKGVSF